MGNYKDRLEYILRAYEEELALAVRNRKPASGILGFGPGPGDDPCHSTLDQAVETLMRDLIREPGGVSEAGPVISRLLRVESEDRWPEPARLMLNAAQRHAIPLIPALDRETREELYAWYEKRHPRYRRFPLHKQILLALKNG